MMTERECAVENRVQQPGLERIRNHLWLEERPTSNSHYACLRTRVNHALLIGSHVEVADNDCSMMAYSFFSRIQSRGRVVGSVGLTRVSESTCELRKMYLAPEARGGGWGRRLLEHALARSADLGFRRVVLETASVLRAATALYERYGFRPDTRDHLTGRCDAAYFLDTSECGTK